ncbi:hypothetical protein EMO92_06930 [Bifidobacterium reuteri]|uniref:Uncharacterized protein n=1 Tax=Bifidobacterium reuteri TaxID=983706 RepID=A0A5J5E7B7_9BIFI|nr:hypothetical protein [Bifidobacterium reuteri]KAA8825147.1 hypothetical protein EMO92_06930 [Bifidobacterium reuteri]
MGYGVSMERLVLTADDLIDYLVSVHPELADPRYVDLDLEPYGKAVKESWVEFPLMFDDLVDRARCIEAQYAKTSYMVERGVDYCCVSRPNRDGDIVSSMCAVIAKDDSPAIILDPNRPIVYGLVRANPERPLRDLIGVQSYLVRVFGDAVGVPGFTVGRLGQLVGTLRELVRLARLDEGDKAGDRAEHSADGAEAGPEHVPPIHEPNTTRREAA